METPTAPTLFAPAAGHRQLVTGNATATRTITWPTNFNNKMGCTAMVHIDLAPFKKPVRSELESTVIEIYTADHSHPPIKAMLFDILFVKLNRLACLMTLPSHGLDEVEFVKYMFDRYPGKMELHTEVAVYYYKKVNG